jgi:hypothetical protein
MKFVFIPYKLTKNTFHTIIITKLWTIIIKFVISSPFKPNNHIRNVFCKSTTNECVLVSWVQMWA